MRSVRNSPRSSHSGARGAPCPETGRSRPHFGRSACTVLQRSGRKLVDHERDGGGRLYSDAHPGHRNPNAPLEGPEVPERSSTPLIALAGRRPGFVAGERSVCRVDFPAFRAKFRPLSLWLQSEEDWLGHRSHFIRKTASSGSRHAARDSLRPILCSTPQ